MPPSILSVKGLVKHFAIGRSLTARLLRRPERRVHAVNAVSFEIGCGETLGLIGESGCGKSTLGRTVLRLHEPSAGEIHFDGVDITRLPARALARLRGRMQIVFQDPYACLNPRKSVRQIVGLPLAIQGGADATERDERVSAVLRRVGLRDDQFECYPHQFSGGQRQRVVIAMALMNRPQLLIADEPTTALDVTVQAQVLALLKRLRTERGLSMLFISHDLAVVGQVADRVAVMQNGEIVETGEVRQVLTAPRHAYTRRLLNAAPTMHTDRERELAV
jgi:ABC-type microcin C transport system duplicated ATPase subunit YejF